MEACFFQELRMPFAHVNGQKLYYEDTGGEGPVIVQLLG